MTEVRSEDEAFNKLFEMYELDEFSLVDGDHEIGDNELVIDVSCVRDDQFDVLADRLHVELS